MAKSELPGRASKNHPGKSTECETRMIQLYDRLLSIEKAVSSKNVSGYAPKLFVDGFDAEQVWQQTDQFCRRVLSRAKKHLPPANERLPDLLRSEKDDILSSGDDENHSIEGSENGEVGEESDEREEGVESDENEFGEETNGFDGRKASSSAGPRSNLDDKFFRLSDMDAFCEQAEREENADDISLDIGEYADGSDARARYTDFFDPPSSSDKVAMKVPPPQEKVAGKKSKKRVSFDPSIGGNENENEESGASASDTADIPGETGPLSTFEQRQRKLRSVTSALEESNLSGRGWQLSGEADAQKRPDNSILEEHLAFDRATKLQPVITEETTVVLEDLIKQRIKDKAFDDVQRKIKPTLDPAKYRNELILDQQKSTKSLAEVYEAEFMKQTEREKEEKRDPKHEEIERDMKHLFEYLDGLYNFHYTPKMARAELRVVNNAASLRAEEVAPKVGSDATTLAPEEIMASNARPPVALSERTDAEVSRARRKRKIRAKIKAKRTENAQIGKEDDSQTAMRKLAKFAKVDKKKALNSDAKGAALLSKLQQQAADDVRAKDEKLTVRGEKKKVLLGNKYKL